MKHIGEVIEDCCLERYELTFAGARALARHQREERALAKLREANLARYEGRDQDADIAMLEAQAIVYERPEVL